MLYGSIAGGSETRKISVNGSFVALADQDSLGKLHTIEMDSRLKVHSHHLLNPQFIYTISKLLVEESNISWQEVVNLIY